MVEESKERTGRYTFVNSLLPSLIAKDATDQEKTLTINLIRLSLTVEEAEKFFTGLSQSDDKAVADVGNAGITDINKEKTAIQIAAEKEREGFLNLINGKDADATNAFEAAVKAFPTYHSVYEIAELLKKEKSNLQNSEVRKRVLRRIVDEYSWKAPPDLIGQLRKSTE